MLWESNFCHKICTYLIRLTKSVNLPRTIVIILIEVLTFTYMTILEVAWPNINWFWSFLGYGICKPFCISNIKNKWWWYVIRLFHNWFSLMKFDLYSKTKDTLSNFMFMPYSNAIHTCPIALDWMLYLLAIMRSQIFKQIILMKTLQLLI